MQIFNFVTGHSVRTNDCEEAGWNCCRSVDGVRLATLSRLPFWQTETNQDGKSSTSDQKNEEVTSDIHEPISRFIEQR
jgi:hypothetical protein